MAEIGPKAEELRNFLAGDTIDFLVFLLVNKLMALGFATPNEFFQTTQNYLALTYVLCYS